MGFLDDLAFDQPAVGLAVGAVLALVLWLAWRRPTLVLMIALASLALRPQLLWGGPAIGYEWGLHHTLIVIGLAANALRHGIRLQGGWPIAALLATFVLSIAFGDLHPKLTLPFMLMSLGILVLPFTFTQVVLAPGTRRAYGLVIIALPLLSVALGGLLQLSSTYEMFDLQRWNWNIFRLEGATGNAAVFATLAFAGFAVALHEMTRLAWPYVAPFAVINLALVILSGTRMGIFASGVFLFAYLILSEDLRAHLRLYRTRASIGLCSLGAVVILYWPTLQDRMLLAQDGELQLSGRDELWSFYFGEWWLSPAFGRGSGAGFIAAEALNHTLPTPHNEYVHLLVFGGVVGFVLIVGAVVLWYRLLLQIASPTDKHFMLALAPALLTYAITDNIFIYSSSLALYAYLGVLHSASAPSGVPMATAMPLDRSKVVVDDSRGSTDAGWQGGDSVRVE